MPHLTGKNTGLADDMEIRLLAPDDLESAHALSSTIGWNQRLDDWRMLTSLAPGGSFAAVDTGRIVGTAIGIDYTAFGWVAMMLVDPAYRGRGLGARLLEAALTALPPGLPVRLDATPLGRPLYERYGFVPETTLTRHLRAGGQTWTRSGSDPDPGRASPVPALGQTSVSGGAAPWAGPGLTPNHPRQRLLQWMHANAPEYAFALGDGPQYCLGRHGRLFDQLGPVVADTADAAAALAGAALSNTRGAVIVDAYDSHEPFTAWLRSAGFEPQRPLYRMCRGASLPPAHANGPIEFAIVGPEFG